MQSCRPGLNHSVQFSSAYIEHANKIINIHFQSKDSELIVHMHAFSYVPLDVETC